MNPTAPTGSEPHKIVYHEVYAVRVDSTGISANPDITYVNTIEEVGDAVVGALKRAQSWNWITVRREEIRAS